MRVVSKRWIDIRKKYSIGQVNKKNSLFTKNFGQHMMIDKVYHIFVKEKIA